MQYIAAPGIIIPCCYRCWRCTSVACVFVSSRMTIRQVWTGCLLFTAVDACSALDDAMQQSYRCSQQAYTATRLSLVAAVAALELQLTHQVQTALTRCSCFQCCGKRALCSLKQALPAVVSDPLLLMAAACCNVALNSSNTHLPACNAMTCHPHTHRLDAHIDTACGHIHVAGRVPRLRHLKVQAGGHSSQGGPLEDAHASQVSGACSPGCSVASTTFEVYDQV